MASITRLDKDGNAVKRGGVKYRVRYRTPSGGSRSRTFDKMHEAETFLTSVEHRKLTGEYVDTDAGRITFGEYADRWLDMKRTNKRPSTIGTWSAHINKHLRPEFGRIELRAIEREHVKTFAAGLGERVAPTTARAIVFTLAAILREAVDDNRLARNPADRISVGHKTERRVDPMHVAGISVKVPELAGAMPERWRAGVLLMASVGLRLGECLGLSVDRVDFLRRTIRVDRQLVKATTVGSAFGPPKTRAGVRTIPVPSHVIDMLAAHLAEFPPNDDGLIFTTRSGGAVPRSNWSHAYRAACADVGLVGRTRTHDLRHVAASSMIAAGLSVAAVQAALGHSSPAETLEVYTHLWPSDEERTREAIEQGSAAWFTAAN